MDRYLSGEEIDPKVLIDDLEKAVALGSFYPVLATVAAPRDRPGRAARDHDPGVPLAQRAPAARRHHARRQAGQRPVQRPEGPAAGRGGQDHLRPVRGPGQPGPGVLRHAAAGRQRARVRARAWPSAATPTTTPTSASARSPRRWASSSGRSRPAPAGDICAVAKLGTAETGDTLSDPARPLLMEPWSMPEPLLPVAITAKSKADEDKMSQALGRLVAEDPTLRMENNAETRQLVLWCMGEAHADLMLDRLANRYGVAVETVELRVPLRETVAGQGQRAGPQRQAERRPRRVRHRPHRGRAAAVRIRLRVRRQDRRRRGAAAVHPVGGEGPPVADGAGRHRRLPDGGHQGHPVRRQGALGGLLRHGVPEGRPGRAAGRRGEGEGRAARAGGRGVGAGRRRLRRRDHVRLPVPARPGDRHRAGRDRAHDGQGGGPGAGDHQVRHRPAVAVARHRLVQPQVPAARAAARRTWRRRWRRTRTPADPQPA